MDLLKLERISLAGMVEMYLAGTILEGNDPLVAPLMEENDINAVDGWGAIHRICEATEQRIVFKRVHLLSTSSEMCRCLEMPTLVIAGREDVLFPLEHQAILADRLPKAQLEPIKRASHNPQMERTADVIEAIKQFMATANPSCAQNGVQSTRMIRRIT